MSPDRSLQCPNICSSRRGYCLYRASIIDVVLFVAASDVSICGLKYWDRTQPDATRRSNLLGSRREVIGSLIDIGVVRQRWIPWRPVAHLDIERVRTPAHAGYQGIEEALGSARCSYAKEYSNSNGCQCKQRRDSEEDD